MLSSGLQLTGRTEILNRKHYITKAFSNVQINTNIQFYS